MTYAKFFKGLTGHEAYRYQQQLADLLLDGRSVVLRAPTGAGKTWATVAPFLFGLHTRTTIADRLIYALPLRSLATKLHRDVITAMRSETSLFGSVLETGKDRDYGSATRFCSLQIGGERNDPFLESDLIFTTIDQLLSGYLGLPVSLPKRLGNMVAGALIGSFIVFDEVHLLDPDKALGTVIEMLSRLKGLCQFVLMTATLSEEGVRWLARKLDAEVFRIPDDEIRELPSERTKERTWRWTADHVSSELVRKAHSGGRTLVLMNTVGAAQQVFQDLVKAYACSATRVLLLHARFYPDDRKAIESELDSYFGPDASRADVILISTQVVEAGIDISADHLITELAPMNALVQRAGRVARYEHRNVGTVTVCSVERPHPYQGQEEVTGITRDLLQSLPSDGQMIDFAAERVWIDRAHREEESRALSAYENLYERERLVQDAMEGEAGRRAELVRDSDSVSLIITETPKGLNFTGRSKEGKRIGWPRLLSVPRSSLMRFAPQFQNLGTNEWVAMGAQETGDSEVPGVGWAWEVVTHPGALRAQWLIAIHPKFATYSVELGLVLGTGGAPIPVLYTEAPQIPRYQYEFEEWTKHAIRVRDRARAMHAAHRRGAERLARSAVLRTTAEMIEALVELASVLHDVGKLSSAWQAAIWRWQRDKDERLRRSGVPVPLRPKVPIAHSTYNPDSDWDVGRSHEYRRPHHAAEGAYAVHELVTEQITAVFGSEHDSRIAPALISAIARHHTPAVSKVTDFQFAPSARNTLGACLGLDDEKVRLATYEGHLTQSVFSIININMRANLNSDAWVLYAFLVRRLRLADQSSQNKTTRD